MDQDVEALLGMERERCPVGKIASILESDGATTLLPVGSIATP